MDARKPVRVKYQESGGGWGNPLMGRVFDSDQDVPEEEFSRLVELVDGCDLKTSGEMPGRPPTDVPSFELRVERDDRTVRLVGDMPRADEKLRALISFIRDHSRREMLK